MLQDRRLEISIRLQIEGIEFFLDDVVESVTDHVYGNANGIRKPHGVSAPVTLDHNPVEPKKNRAIIDPRVKPVL